MAHHHTTAKSCKNTSIRGKACPRWPSAASQAWVRRFESPLGLHAGWPGRYINVWRCGRLSMVLLQLTDPLELFVKRREFSSRFWGSISSRYDLSCWKRRKTPFLSSLPSQNVHYRPIYMYNICARIPVSQYAALQVGRYPNYFIHHTLNYLYNYYNNNHLSK